MDRLKEKGPAVAVGPDCGEVPISVFEIVILASLRLGASY